MASAQCCKPVEKTSCHNESQHHSFGQKVSEMTHSVFKGHGSNHSHGQATECGSQGKEKAHPQYPNRSMSHLGQNQCMNQTNGHHGQHHAPGDMACQRKVMRQGATKKRGLLQKIKDGISGDSSDSSSSSDSESDNEKCGTRKN